MNRIIPNSTQIPHLIIREWMPLLKDIELRVLLIVTDQTLGWIEDKETGRRKEKDWISHYQLRTKVKRRGGKPCGSRSISRALVTLVDNLRIIEALDEQGQLLDSPYLRMKNGGKIFYRLSLRAPQATLFPTLAKRTGAVNKLRTNQAPWPKARTPKVALTKENYLTEKSHKQGFVGISDHLKKWK